MNWNLLLWFLNCLFNFLSSKLYNPKANYLTTVSKRGRQHNWSSPSGLKVNAFDQWGFQCDREVVQRLKDANKSAESARVSEHCCVLIHLQDHRTVHKQGEPLGQQAISGSEADQQLELSVLADVPGSGVDCVEVATKWLTCYPQGLCGLLKVSQMVSWLHVGNSFLHKVPHKHSLLEEPCRFEAMMEELFQSRNQAVLSTQQSSQTASLCRWEHINTQNSDEQKITEQMLFSDATQDVCASHLVNYSLLFYWSVT